MMSDNLYQISIDSIPLNVVVYRYIDNEFVIVDFNHLVEQTEQLDRKSLLNKKLLDVFPADKEFGLYDVLEQVYQTGKTQTLDKELYHDDRLQGWRKNTVVKLPNQDVMAIYEDLTAIKQLEQEKDRRQFQLEKMQEIARLGSWTWNMLTDEIEWSNEVFKLFDEPPQSFKPTFQRFLSYIDDADQPALMDAIDQAIKNKSPYQFEHWIRLASTGRSVYLLESGKVQYDEKGQPLMMFGVVQDITEYKLNLDQLQSLGLIIDNSFNEVFVFDAETLKFTYLNQSALKNLGYTLDEVRRMEPYQINPAFSSRQQFVDELLEPLISGKKASVIHETVHRRKDGTEYDVQVRIQKMQLSGKEAFVVMANDITDIKKQQKKSEIAQARYQTLFNLSPVGILLVDPATQKAFEFNVTAHQQLGYSAAEFADLTIADYEALEQPEEIATKVAQFKVGEEVSFTTQHKTKTGDIRDVMVFVQLIDLYDHLALFAVFQDITELKRNERALETASLRFNLAAEVGSMGVWEWDLETDELIWDDNMRRLYDLEGGQSIDHYRQWRNMLTPEDLQAVEGSIDDAMKTGAELNTEFQLRTPKGREKHIQVMAAFVKDDNGKPIKMVGVNWDVSQRKQYERALEEYAYIDPLTQVANRRQFDQTFENEWRRGERNQSPLSLLMIDIDFFKAFNDSLGHQEGDDCLQQVAKAIDSSASRAGELTARYGGEEFVVLLPNNDADKAARMAETIRQNIESLKLPHPDSSISDHVTISVGFTTADFIDQPSSHTPSQLLKLADEALYQAKKAGRNRVCRN
ncbi:hypothetical protein CYQ88_07310 [Hydrogenovibrio sp. SC-1]|uniref:diguanylate cyclase domain-containing protein n=1 Tax=Hydrogenovibrio sp. SC-1 TaxID=2065820 RepID=UPI000C7DFEA9|nr:diguanylate cyclase [Hydrogenovibrio sp. SC-1]PLA74180.1 hypothetical protein CYQ88_07310 [Hydrogenovibrio sp. SC-1]